VPRDKWDWLLWLFTAILVLAIIGAFVAQTWIILHFVRKYW